MRLTVLGGCGAWPARDEACSGYLLEERGHRLLVDPGYATLPRLQRLCAPGDVDAVFVSHGHPDHCADLNPLLRARALQDEPAPPLPVLSPAGALDRVLALDTMRAMDAAVDLRPLSDGAQVRSGPFTLTVAELPHHVTDLGVRIESEHASFAYTGDAGPDRAVVDLAVGVDLLLIEATYPDEVPSEDRGLLGDLPSAVGQGEQSGARHTLLTHWWPLTGQAAFEAALEPHRPAASLARPGSVHELGGA